MQVIDPINGIFYVCVLIMSVVIHEFAHGYVAYRYGDQTARAAGRLTLNPLKHLDLFGSVILPLLLILMQAGFVIGWARPVPYNPRNLRGGRKSVIMVSLAGIIANVLIAVIFGLLIRFGFSFDILASDSNPLGMHPFYVIASIIVFTNLVLAVFNIISIPPLDGSKVLFSLLPARLRFIENFLTQWGMFLLLLFIIFLWSRIEPIISVLFSLITGL
ncbi:MAG: site-2 protease family protein [Patescibacteria group bacterium]